MKSVLVSNTNLFRLAAIYLGDATRWEEIARANGLVDPMIGALCRLVIPEASESSSGNLRDRAG